MENKKIDQKNDLSDFEVRICKMVMNNKGRKGRIVETQSEVLGVLYNDEDSINGKLQVHCEDGKKLLCSPENLKLRGYFD